MHIKVSIQNKWNLIQKVILGILNEFGGYHLSPHEINWPNSLILNAIKDVIEIAGIIRSLINATKLNKCI